MASRRSNRIARGFQQFDKRILTRSGIPPDSALYALARQSFYDGAGYLTQCVEAHLTHHDGAVPPEVLEALWRELTTYVEQRMDADFKTWSRQ